MRLNEHVCGDSSNSSHVITGERAEVSPVVPDSLYDEGLPSGRPNPRLDPRPDRDPKLAGYAPSRVAFQDSLGSKVVATGRASVDDVAAYDADNVV